MTEAAEEAVEFSPLLVAPGSEYCEVRTGVLEQVEGAGVGFGQLGKLMQHVVKVVAKFGVEAVGFRCCLLHGCGQGASGAAGGAVAGQQFRSVGAKGVVYGAGAGQWLELRRGVSCFL
ncbi:hypothetical protein [Streptomyces smyrnaeus]|uniref:hypothetical protein n=1 Tax=Streptomyces smyrnaeus TaxID=1387713 RepID=UPI003699E4F8